MCTTRLNSRPLRLFTIFHFLLVRLTLEAREVEVLVLGGGGSERGAAREVIVVVTQVVGREVVGFEGDVLLLKHASIFSCASTSTLKMSFLVLQLRYYGNVTKKFLAFTRVQIQAHLLHMEYMHCCALS